MIIGVANAPMGSTINKIPAASFADWLMPATIWYAPIAQAAMIPPVMPKNRAVGKGFLFVMSAHVDAMNKHVV